MHIYLPAKSDKLTEESERKDETMSLPTANILLIDDDPIVAETIGEMLHLEGHRVEIHNKPETALRSVRVGKYDLVITDLGMSGMSGWEVGKEIRTSAPGTPVFLITGWGDEFEEEQIQESGVTRVIAKPFRRHDILKAISETLTDWQSAP